MKTLRFGCALSLRVYALIAAAGVLATLVLAEPSERISRVESGLTPRIYAEGQLIKWSLKERMAHHRVPGVSIAVINDGQLEWARGYGTLEAGGSTPVTADTVFQAASISKPVSALAVLRLVEAGKLKLDEDVNLALKSWKVPDNTFTADEKVTVRRMLSHTAGLTVHGFRGYAEGESVPTLVQVLDGAPPSNSGPIRVDIKPGTQERYSGGGYVVLTQLVRDVTGESFESALQQSVFKPLGMTRSTFEQPLPGAWSSNAARAHRGDGTAIPGKWHTYPELAPDALWTTPSDLARFAIELRQAFRGESRKVISPEMAKQMLTRQLRAMGLGIVINGNGDSLRFEHGGSNAGFRCHLVTYPMSGRGAVIMTNSDSGGALIQEIQRAIAAEYGWPDYRPVERKPVAVDPQVLAGYVGRYRTPAGGPIVNVRFENGSLGLDVDGKRVHYIAESAARFRILDDESSATFFTVNGQTALWAQNRFWPKLTEASAPAGRGTAQTTAAAKPETRPAGTFLVLRNTSSWRRPTDFEHVLRAFGHTVELRGSSAMADLDLSKYTTIIVPGAQPRDEYYATYVRHAKRFDEFVEKGGTLVFELNGAENTSIVLPRGVTMASHGAVENSIIAADHPIFAPFAGERLIRANFASHGYLSGVPSDAVVLAAESRGSETLADRPTFVEYTHGKGRVIAACQCFHDQDGSGRGPWMATLLHYTALKPWAAGN